MPTVTTRRVVSAAWAPALATLGLGLVACGVEVGSGQVTAVPDPGQVVLASYEDLEGESYTMAATATIDGIDFLAATHQVAGDAARTSQHLYLSALLPLPPAERGGRPALPEVPPVLAELESLLTDLHTESILVDEVLYLQATGGRFDSLADQFGPDAWFTLDLAAHGDAADVHGQLGTFDLASQTELLLNDLTDVEETSDGVYTGTLAADSDALRSLLTGVPGAAAALDQAEVVITVDDQGLLQRLEITTDLEGATLRLVNEVTEVGADHVITAPESDNLHPLEELLRAVGR